MRSTYIFSMLGVFGAAAGFSGAPSAVHAQSGQNDIARARLASASGDNDDPGDEPRTVYKFKSRSDSIEWERSRALAARSTGFRLIVSLQDRHIWAVAGEDTVLSAPAAVAKGTTLKFGNTKYTFVTPRGARTVLGKEADPVWQPPEWLYAETAAEHDLVLGHLYPGKPVKVDATRTLTVRDGLVGLVEDGTFSPMPTDEHIVFGRTLYVPPMGTKNRKVEGELGKYRLILGDGYLLHGTPYQQSIGLAATHGCVRLRDEDIEWLYENVRVGTKVYIY